MTRHARGFTLIELLLAMGMVAMLTLSLYVGMSTAFRAKQSVGRQTDAMRQAKAALDLIEQDLRSVLPPSGTLAGPFIGTNDGGAGALSATIDCYSLGADFGRVDQPNNDGMRHVQILMVQNATLPVLAREVVRDLFSGDNSNPEEEILARDISGFGVRYYDGAAWLDEWDSTQMSKALPLAAELTIEIKTPTRTDPNSVYRLTRIVTLPCGQTAEQATALAAAAETAAAGGTTGTTIP